MAGFGALSKASADINLLIWRKNPSLLGVFPLFKQRLGHV